SQMRESGRSLLAFGLGLLLASLYGTMTLFVQKQPLWFCAYATQVLAALAAFGMGLSSGVRASVMVLLPSLCSNYGRKFLLFFYFSLLWSGPVANTVENIERTSASLLCGAELAANQTQELMQRAATPLYSSLAKIREIGRKALSAARRIHSFIDALTEGARHVARTLRNVLHFLADIGDVCNDRLGTPYWKCRALFAKARDDCEELLGEFDFLCQIVGAFQPLCNLARAGQLFCIIPAYVAQHLRERLEAPVAAAFAHMKREFDFNFSASVIYDLQANGSRSLQEISQDILSEVSAQMRIFQVLGAPLAYLGFALLILSFVRAAQYRRAYLRDLNFDNIYITEKFQELDRQVSAQGGASVLPITPREARTYLPPLSLRLTAKEKRLVLSDVLAIFRHLAMGSVLVALDFLVFWMLDQVQQLVKEDVVARPPVLVTVVVNGTGYASDIFRDLVASFNILQGGNITVISRRCLLRPAEPDRSTCLLLGFLLGLALLLSLTRGFVQRCRRLACARYYPEQEERRIRHLRQQILDGRRTLGLALRLAAARFRADGGGGAAGGAGRGLQRLLLRLPGGAHLCRLLTLSPVRCLSCGEVLREEGDMATCGAPQCPGLYCRPCYHSLGNACMLCVP
uniref:DC-STAMP domain containing 2 n=1 Tax=Tetraodon nigroviridis TaxID=99883 RepID=H3C6R0_TETNG